MPIVEKILDKPCEKLFRLSDKTVIIQHKKKCDTKWKEPKDFQKQRDDITADVSSTIFISDELFKDIKEGQELPISGIVKSDQLPHLPSLNPSES